MTNRNLARGTAWASDIVKYLQEHGRPHAERRALNGAHDGGDIAALIGVVIEAKNEKHVARAEYVYGTTTEQGNAAAAVEVGWIKRRGRASPGDGYLIMSSKQFIERLREADY